MYPRVSPLSLNFNSIELLCSPMETILYFSGLLQFYKKKLTISTTIQHTSVSKIKKQGQDYYHYKGWTVKSLSLT